MTEAKRPEQIIIVKIEVINNICHGWGATIERKLAFNKMPTRDELLHAHEVRCGYYTEYVRGINEIMTTAIMDIDYPSTGLTGSARVFTLLHNGKEVKGSIIFSEEDFFNNKE